MSNDFFADEHGWHSIVYNVLWCPRRCKPILVGDLGARCRRLIERALTKRGWHAALVIIESDYVRLLQVQTPSDVSAFEVVKACKRATSLALKQEFPELLSMPSLWTRSALVSTERLEDDMVAAYLEQQPRR